MKLSSLKSSLKEGYFLTKQLMKGYVHFKQKGNTPTESYLAMRKVFAVTDGRFNDLTATLSSMLYPKYRKINKTGLLGTLSSENIRNIVEEINKNGYYIFKNFLPNEQIEKLLYFAKHTPAKVLTVNEDTSKFSIAYEEKLQIFNEANIISPRYQFTFQQLIDEPVIQEIIADPSILSIAQEYLGSRPVLDLLAMWWSAPFHGKGKSESAQMYHYDMDRLKFIKFFFYLTEVDADNGPHCYVRSSHKRKPVPLRVDGRKEDQQIESFYSAEDIVEIKGKRGTILAVDTRGFHKGKTLTNGNRLLFQIEFANSLFGQNYPKLHKPEKWASSFQQMLEEYPFTYQQIFE